MLFRIFNVNFLIIVSVYRIAKRKLLNLIVNAFPKQASRLSFSQSGEDMIIDFALKAMRINKPTYLDIGANHPFIYNNTYYFYRQGCRGVSIEPDPNLYSLLKAKRPNDINLNIGVSAGAFDKLPFYIMSNPTLNSFSEEEVLRYTEFGSYKIERVINGELMPIAEIFEKYFDGGFPDILSIDVEGMDLKIIESIDFTHYRPLVICIETLLFSESREIIKSTEINNHLLANGYIVYADTHINTIFVDKQKWTSSR